MDVGAGRPFHGEPSHYITLYIVHDEFFLECSPHSVEEGLLVLGEGPRGRCNVPNCKARVEGTEHLRGGGLPCWREADGGLSSPLRSD